MKTAAVSFVAIISLFLGLTSLHGQPRMALMPDESLSRQDIQFFQGINAILLGEQALGKLGIAKASNQAVKDYARMIADDHEITLKELNDLTVGKDIVLPTEPTSYAKTALSRLSQLSGAEFDREYMSFMAGENKRGVDEFQEEVSNGHDARLQLWTTKKIGTMRHHLETARAILGKLNVKK